MTAFDKNSVGIPARHRSGPTATSRPHEARTLAVQADLVGVRDRVPQALDQFFELYFDRVYAWAFRLLGERSGAEDVVQEVFLRVHRGAASLDPKRDPWPWLMSIAYNICRDFWRSGARQMSRSAVSIDEHPELTGSLASTSPSPDSGMIEKEQEERVQRAILKLPDTQRTAVLLRDYMGMSHDAIARIAGMTPTAARKCYSRALAKLGKLLQEGQA